MCLSDEYLKLSIIRYAVMGAEVLWRIYEKFYGELWVNAEHFQLYGSEQTTNL